MNRFFGIASVGHLILLASVSLFFIPKQETVIEHAYVYSSIQNFNQNLNKSNLTEHGLIKKVDQNKKSTPLISTQTESVTKNSADKLLELLHNKIASLQQYPENAITLNQTGKVTLSMIVHPNGMITQIAVTKSSGIESLDAAALNAVQSASPIKEASKYLAISRPFSVDVVFSL